MHIKNIDIFIALSTIMLQLPTEVENSLLNPIWMMIFFLKPTVLFDSMNQAASYWSSIPHHPNCFPGLGAPLPPGPPLAMPLYPKINRHTTA